MELVNILIAIFTFCILVISLLYFLKIERRHELENSIPSPAPAQSILSNSWASVENFINQGENSIEDKEDSEKNVIQSAQEKVEFRTVDSDKSTEYKVPILVDSYMQYESAFDNYILKDPSELNIPLDNSSSALVENTNTVIETPPLDDTPLKEQKDNHLDRESANAKINEILRDSILNSISKLKIKEQDMKLEHFENNEEFDEEAAMDMIFQFIEKTKDKVKDKISEVATPLIGNLSSTLFEGFTSEEVLAKIQKLVDNTVSAEAQNASPFKINLMQKFLNTLQNTFSLNEL